MNHKATTDAVTFKRDWSAGLIVEQICDRHTLTADQVLSLSVLWKLPPRRNHFPLAKRQSNVDPTPSQIVERAAECRARRASALSGKSDQMEGT